MTGTGSILIDRPLRRSGPRGEPRFRTTLRSLPQPRPTPGVHRGSRGRLYAGLVLALVLHAVLFVGLGRIVIRHRVGLASPIRFELPVVILPVGVSQWPAGDAGTAPGEMVSVAMTPAAASPTEFEALPPVDVPVRFSDLPPVIAVEFPTASYGVPEWIIGEAGVSGDGTGQAGWRSAPGAGDPGGVPGGVGGQGAPRYFRNPPPTYPAEATANGWEGTVLLRVEVLPDGKAGDLEIVESSGHEVLDAAAVAAVRRWRFIPARANNVPVAARVEVPVSFRLGQG